MYYFPGFSLYKTLIQSFSGLSLFRNRNVTTPERADTVVLKIKLPMMYCRRLFLMSSKLRSWLRILLSPCTNGAPKNKEAAMIKG